MKYELTFLPPAQREGAKVCFAFKVSNELSHLTVAVGIPIEFNATAEPLGSKPVPQDELIKCAKAWLDTLLNEGECDPFARPETDTKVDVPLSVLDHWRDQHSIPPRLL